MAGDFNADSAKAWVQKYFGSIPRSPAAIHAPGGPAHHAHEGQRTGGGRPRAVAARVLHLARREVVLRR
ncbi:hypothetical protein [Gemmatimonas sp.]|uniref:hypothetical protein n=1 Tax=Gemmatimonas sp. TaxID=1962908 RepID=UPI003DA649C0